MSDTLIAQGVSHERKTVAQVEYRSCDYRDLDGQSIKQVLSELIDLIGQKELKVSFKVLGFRDFAIETNWPLDDTSLDRILFCFDDDVQIFVSDTPLLTFIGDRAETNFEEARIYLHQDDRETASVP